MTQVVQRRTFVEVIRDHHTRIRRLEAAPGGGGSASGSECDRCYYVNPGDIYVEPEYRECTTAYAGSFEWETVCGDFGTPVGSMSFGKCGMALLGYGVAVRGLITFGSPGEMENFLINGEGPTFGSPSTAPDVYDTGWFLLAGQPCGLDCNDDITISASFYAANSGFGNCTLGGAVYAKWVPLDEDGEWDGALADIPAGEAYGDVVYFTTSPDPKWRTGARSIPSRAISFFNSVLTSITRL